MFTSALQRHVDCPTEWVDASTLRAALEAYFVRHEKTRGYVLDDQSALRKHMTIFVDGHMIRDRTRLADAVSETSTIYVFQALSGG